MNYTCKDLTEKELYLIKYKREYENYVWIAIVVCAIFQGCIYELETHKTPIEIFVQYLKKRTLYLPHFIKTCLIIFISIGIGQYIPTIQTQFILTYLLTFYIFN